MAGAAWVNGICPVTSPPRRPPGRWWPGTGPSRCSRAGILHLVEPGGQPGNGDCQPDDNRALRPPRLRNSHAEMAHAPVVLTAYQGIQKRSPRTAASTPRPARRSHWRWER